MEFKDYYQTLGVSKNATADEIKKAFRGLARKHHPDRASPDDRPAAESKFKEISEAYDVLGDAEKRQKYDQLGANWQQYGDMGAGGFPRGQHGGFHRQHAGPGGYEFHFGGTGFSDFFEQFFGGGFESYTSGSRPRATRGRDVEAEIMTPLSEVYTGAERTIRLERVNPQTGERKENAYKVRIPAGVKDGQRIRLGGQGEAGSSGMTGDLYLKVRIAPHPDYEVSGLDLIYSLELPAWDAALGASKEIPLPNGKRVRVNIPAGAKSGSRVRLRGLGLPAKQGAGDLFVEYAIVAPKPADDESKRLWEQLRDLG